MKTVITALVVQVELTQYNDEGQVVGRAEKPPTFAVLEAAIPTEVKEWVQQSIQKGA